jgi:hypothetical protein
VPAPRSRLLHDVDVWKVRGTLLRALRPFGSLGRSDDGANVRDVSSSIMTRKLFQLSHTNQSILLHLLRDDIFNSPPLRFSLLRTFVRGAVRAQCGPRASRLDTGAQYTPKRYVAHICSARSSVEHCAGTGNGGAHRPREGADRGRTAPRTLTRCIHATSLLIPSIQCNT